MSAAATPAPDLDAAAVDPLLADARLAFASGDFTRLRGVARQVLRVEPRNAEAWHLAGLGEAGCGDVARGVALLTRAAELAPGHALVLGNLGQLLLKQGDAQAALQRLQQAVQLAPEQAALHFAIGNAWVSLGSDMQALPSYQRCLALEPDHVQALNNRGILHTRLGHHEAALQDFEHCLRLRPLAWSAWVNQGNALKAMGRLEAAVAAFEHALSLRQDLPEALNNLGNALVELQRHDQALARFEQALRLRPQYAEAWRGQGLALVAAGRKAEAHASFDRAIELQPQQPQAHASRADLLLSQQRVEEALRGYDQALALQAENATTLNNRGNALRLLGRLQEAHASYTRAIELDPRHVKSHCNRAMVAVELARFDAALAGYRRAIEIDPAFAEARFGLGMLQLQLGEFDSGWSEYEWRWSCPAEKPHRRSFAAPLWQGQLPLAGQTLLLHAEQGLGDTLQFCRYAPLAAAAGARVLLEAPPRMRRLLGSLPGVHQLLERGAALPAFDLHCPLASLPLAFGTRLDTIPGDTPYLRADADLVALWRARIGSKGFRIAIAWQGSTGEIDRGRSFPLRQLEPLARLPGVRLISLQKNHGVEQLADLPAGMRVETLGEGFDRGPEAFVDSAAVMGGVDLVISSDTALAHLAGALGVPVWLALKAVPDWRWLLDRQDSPWYPTMRLFRQSAPGRWDEVFERMRQALAQAGGPLEQPAGVEPMAG